MQNRWEGENIMNRLSKNVSRAALTASAAIFALSVSGTVLAQEVEVAQEADTDTDGANDDLALEEFVVTAQKRTEALAEIPQSVTVLTGGTLERQHADNFQDYLSLIPGLSLAGATPGVSRITLRGINTGGVASTVGIYVDEVPFGSSSGLANGASLAGDFDTFDVTRLEVLRGPQGTLYGASSLGGVLKFVTNPPSTEGFEARGQGGVEPVEGGDLGYSGTGLVNIPLTDQLAIRASGFYRSDDGFIDSIGNNPIPSLLDPSINIVEGTRIAEDVNELDTFGGRISGLFEPGDNLSVRITALLQNIESAASDYFEADPVTLEPLYGDLVLSQYHPEFTDIDYRVYSGTVDWDLGFANLVSSTSYATFEQDFQVDLAFGLAPVVTLLFGDPVNRPLSAILEQTTGTDKLTQELRLSSPDNESLEWLVGAFYTEEKSRIDPQDLFAVEAGTETIAAGVPQVLEVFLTSNFEEYAAFANATWHLTPRIDLTFGGRASRNEQVASQLIDDSALGGGRTAFEDARSSENVFTYSVAPRFELSDDASIYTRIATGYRPGGPNVLPSLAPPGTPTTYDSDTLTSYEVGLKADWLDRRYSLDIAAYYLDWEDIQLFAVINDTGVNANGGTAIGKGVEFTAAARPAPGLTFSLNGAYT
nr:TonB-dependent receptor [Gammaproteobacteria bacterium]